MIGEIVAIGDELITGRIQNTTSGYAARMLYGAGYTIRSIHTIGDSFDLIGPTIRTSLATSDFVIITGGLGPTTDDLTNEAVIKALDLKGCLYEPVIESIQARVPTLNSTQRMAAEKLAWLPENATVLDKDYRMAGYVLPYEGKPLFFLPGIPPQMEQLLTTRVIPALNKWYPPTGELVRQQVYRTFGLFESEINDRLASLENNPSLQLGYYPVGCEVHVSLTVRARDAESAEKEYTLAETAIHDALGPCIYGTGDQSMAEVIGELLMEKRKMLCVAESCTGGLIGSTLTTVAGSSRWFAGGVIAYSNALKEKLLKVDRALLENYGAVSPQAARAMAARLAANLKCSTAVSATGIAGPGGGTEQKPVGTVYIGLYHDNRVEAVRYQFTGNRNEIQEKTAATALDTVRRALLNL